MVPGFEPGSQPTAEETARHAAMKLPDSAPQRPQRPNPPRHGFGRGGNGRPSRDAERLAGKSRKVH